MSRQTGNERAPGRRGSCDQTRIREFGDPYRHVRSLFDRINEAVGQRQLDLELRMFAHELGNGGAR